MTRMYDSPAIDSQWAHCRNTHHAVATAIHAIASGDRTPDAIWEAPTAAEWDHVHMAVEDYVLHGDYAYSARGYQWGEEAVHVAPPAGEPVTYKIIDHDGGVIERGLSLEQAANAVMTSDGREWRITRNENGGEWAAWSRHQTAGRPWGLTGFTSYHDDEKKAREAIFRQIVQAERMGGHCEAVPE